MKKNYSKISAALTLALAVFCAFCTPIAYAEGEDSTSQEGSESSTSISLMPVSKILQISSSSEYQDKLTVNNDGNGEMQIEVYAAPYAYVYSESEDAYKLGFNNDNNFTQITRWITFKDKDGNWVKNPTFTIPAKQSLDVEYKISTPDNIPAGGQYAVIFAHTLTGSVSANGIKTEASPGLIVYGRSTEGEARIEPVISDAKVQLGITENGVSRSNFYASAKVKNNGNVDFSAVGKLVVQSIIGGGSYETPSNAGRISVIPEAELVVHDEWEESPSFGIYKATWTVTAGEETVTVEEIIFVNPLLFVIITIFLLTIITVCVIIWVRKRKDRRSRLAV